MKQLFGAFAVSIFLIGIANLGYAEPVNSDAFLSVENPNNAPSNNNALGFGYYAHIDVNKTYTLQLVAMDTLDKAIAYALEHNIDPQTAGVARTHAQGHLWYILASGVYLTREEAEEAKKRLEARAVPTPWIRTLGAIESLSREANERDM